MNKDRTKKIIRYTFLLGLFLVVLGTSYALFTVTLTGNKKTRIKTGTMSLELLDKNGNSIEKNNNNNQFEYEINIDKAVPISDEEGLNGDSFIFKVRNNGTIPVDYTIYLDDSPLESGEERISDEYVKYSLIKNEKSKTPELLSSLDERKLDTGRIFNGTTNEYELRIWVDHNASNEAMNKVFDAKIRLVGVQATGGVTANYLADYLKSKNEDTNTYVEDDETDDHNLRYIGTSPNNYVSFNGELWRIIGVFNNIDDGTGKKETRYKIMRNESIGNYSWDSSNEGVNNGYGVNEWSQADAMYLLNDGPYWNRASGECIYTWGDQKKDCDFTTTGLKEESKQYIGDAVWYTGAINTALYGDSIYNSYIVERSNIHGKNCSINNPWCNDPIERTTEWTGKVGLIYSTDFAFAAGFNTSDRETCLNNFLNEFLWTINGCGNDIWIVDAVWTITPSDYCNGANHSISFDYHNGIAGNLSSSAYSIYPTVYLKSTVKIINGNGTEEHPYIIE